MRNAVSVRRRVLSALLTLILASGPTLASVPAQALAAEEIMQAAPGEPPEGGVEVLSLRTATSKHYRLPDGTMQAVISEAPVHFEAEDGSWVDIDATFVPEFIPGRYATRSTAYDLSVGREAAQQAPAQIGRDGWRVGIDLVCATEGEAFVLGRTACFAGVFDGVDLVYEAQGDGLKETLVLDSPDAGSLFTFLLEAEGVSFEQDPLGGWTLRDEADAPVMSLGGLCVFDSSRNEADDPAYCDAATMEVELADGGAYVTYSVPDEWLQDPARVFPVYVDPSLSTVSSLDTYVSSAYPATSYNASTELKCGYYDSTTGQNRSYLKFDTSSIPAWARVDSAVFSIYQFHTYYTSTATTTYLAKVTSGWGTSTTWNTKPTHSLISSQSVSGRGVWVNWSSSADTDIKTAVAGWVANPSANYGFMCYQDEGGSQNTTHWRKFCSREYATSTYRPKLVVNYTTIPDAVTSTPTLSSNRAFDWYEEVDRDSDGISDTMNDLPGVGRGAVDLSWTAAARAAGYNIYMYDGDTYEKVGTVFGGSTTAWSSEGCGIHPADSEIDDWNVASRNALTRAASPRAMSEDDEITVPGESGAGLVVTDGKYLYVRQWGTYAGPSAWKKVGTGLADTVKGRDYGTIGPDLSGKAAYSAFYLDGFIYSGYATSPRTIEGVWKDSAEDAEDLATLTFGSDLINRATGQSITGATGALLLTTDGERIYNIAYGIGGSTYNGYTIKVFNSDGSYTGTTATIPMTSDYLDGVFCDGQALYLLQWNHSDAAHVTKVRLSDMKVANQWPIDQATTHVISGCYDDANDVFWLGSLYSGTVHRYLGSGLDLRDDPEPLYEKSTTTAYLDNQNYWFRVVPFNALGEMASISACAAYMPTLENRTVRVNDDPRHTVADLGEAAGHSLSAVLDQSTLEVAVTDLSIATYGPAAQLSRHYNSGRTDAGPLASAPGWIFDFERHLEFSTGSITYRDEAGEGHVFTLEDGAYFPPSGEYSRLEQAGSTYVLTHKDFSRDVFSATTGVLEASYDKSANAVTYTRDADTLTIGAANGQEIVIDYAGGVVAAATCGTEDGTRTVSYATTGTPGVTYFDGTDCEYTVEYGYAGDLLSSITLPDYPETGVEAVWSFAYSGGKIATVQRPADAYAHTDIIYTATSATLATHGDVATASSSSATHDADIETHYTWNPTGTTASIVDPHLAGSAHSAWTYTYGPTNEAVTELSPAGKTVSRELDSRGNVLYEWDEEGHRTAYRYDELDQLTRMTDPRGQATYYTYGTDRYAGSGMLEVEEAVLTASGSRSRTEYDYNAAGLLTEERSLIGGSDWAITRYSDFAASGEAQVTTNVGVKLSANAAPQDLITSREFDAFGSVTSETDAADVTTAVNAYDIAGRQLASTDATGTSTISSYDVLGNVVASRRQATDGTWADRISNDYDAQGRLVTEYYYALDASGTAVVDRSITHVYDASGREIETDDSKVTGSAVTFYDARGAAVRSWAEGSDTSLASASTRSVYDVYGQLTSQLEPGAETSATIYAYLPNGLTSRVDDPDGSYTTYAYDDGGLKTSEVTPAEGGGTATATFSYDVGGRLTSSTTADGATTAYGYDLLARQVSAAADGATASTTVYNTLGWVLSETDSDGVVKTQTYDVCGRVIAETDAGKTTSYALDTLGRMIRKTTPEGDRALYEYDAFGRVSAETQETGASVLLKETTTAYDVLSRPTVTTVHDAVADSTRTTAVSYPAGGSAETIATIGYEGATTTVVLDGAGRESSRSSETSAGTLLRDDVEYDSANRASSWRFRGLGSSRSFDDAARITSQQGEGWAVAGAHYQYDSGTGRKASESLSFAFDGGREEANAYSYSDAGRLVSATVAGKVTSYDHDAAGNLTAVTADGVTRVLDYPDANRLASVSVGGSVVTTFTWDVDNGRRMAQGPLGDADQIRYSYNDDGRLATYANDATGVSATYTYDVHGQRSTAAVSEGAATTAYTFTYEGLTLLRYDAVISTGATETASSVTYLYDGESRPYAGVYASGEATPVVFGILTTDRGDVRELTDISGTPFAFYAYDAYGMPLAAESTATASVDATLAATIAGANVLRYAGYCFDEHSGLYYLSQRYYDPATCQFITKDPAKADGEESAYQYCGGDPVGSVDPSGEAWRHSISTTTGVITRLGYATHANLFSRGSNAVVSHALEATWYYRIDWYWDPARNVCYATATITVTKVNNPTPNVRMYLRAEAVTSSGSATAARTTSGLSYWPSARGSWRYGRVGAGYTTRTLSARSFKSLRMSLTLQTHHNSVVFPKSTSRVVNVKNPYFDRTKGRQQR